jgi:DNA-binding NtrC family response regulator
MTMRVLIADDDKQLKKILTMALSECGIEAAEADSGMKALEMLAREEFDILLLDLQMPDISGLEALKKIKAGAIATEVIILTGNATVATAVEAMKLGAYDYVTKPCTIRELTIVMEKAYEKKKLLSENLLLKSQIKLQAPDSTIITNSPLMHDAVRTALKIAGSGYPVLIFGESGTGKELMAKAIHDASSRAEGPFIPLNCGAIPETMIESELFGHEMGAFTGAHARKPGLLEIADKGTLFLDEIGDMTAPLQVKLLRVIEQSRFFRVGGTREVSVDVRFIAATNKNLKQEAEKGAFREDLYYRVSTLAIQLPPLRERKEDIPLLIEHFLRRQPHCRNKRFSPEALDLLKRYAWPGNVRELHNVVQRALLLSHDDIVGPADLPSDLAVPQQSCGQSLEDIEWAHIQKVLSQCDGHRGKAARILGITPKTLYNKLTAYGEAK